MPSDNASNNSNNPRLPVRPFPVRTFTPVDLQTEIQQLRQMIAELQNSSSAVTVIPD